MASRSRGENPPPPNDPPPRRGERPRRTPAGGGSPAAAGARDPQIGSVRSPIPAPGLIALPLAAAASLALAATAARAPSPSSPAARARVELEVAGVLPLQDDGASVLVLREKGAATLLPLVVPGGDGRALQAALDHRPGRGDDDPSLLDRTIAALGARVTEVELDEAEESGRAARVHLDQGGKAVELAARPSESIPLAVAAGARILTSRRVLDEAGLSRADLDRLAEKTDPKRKDLRL